MTAREAALKALIAYRRYDARPEQALDRLIVGFNLSERDAALATRILNGVLQNMMLLDHYIGHLSSIGIKKLEPAVLDILRLSIYQLVFLDKIPPNAAVNEGVALVRKTASPRAGGFANAVLRKAALAAKSGDLPEIGGGAARRLSVGYSHPEWLVRKLFEVLDAGSAERFLMANNEPDVPVYAQVNTLLTDTDSALVSLAAEAAEARRHEWLDGCVRLRGARKVTRLDAFQKGLIYVQDAAARLAVAAAGPKPGDVVIDGCAAPGGKSFAAAIAMKNKGRVVAFDINGEKLRHIAEGAGRLGVTIIDAMEKDASAPEAALAGKADAVLADVPCSGFGVIRKKPEIRYKTDEGTAGLPGLQVRILSALSSYVKPGGALLYSTCTVLRRENEDVVNLFLQENSGFSKEGFRLPGIGHVESGELTLWPQIHGTDGFYICKLRRAPRYTR